MGEKWFPCGSGFICLELRRRIVIVLNQSRIVAPRGDVYFRVLFINCVEVCGMADESQEHEEETNQEKSRLLKVIQEHMEEYEQASASLPRDFSSPVLVDLMCKIEELVEEANAL